MFGKKKSVSAPEAAPKKAREAKPPKAKKPFLYKNMMLVLLIGGTCAAVPALILAHVNLTDGGDPIFNGFFGTLTLVMTGGTVVGMMEEKRKIPGARPRSSAKAARGDEASPAKKKEKPARKSKKKKVKPPKGEKKGWFSGKKKAKDEPAPQATDGDVSDVLFEEAEAEEA